MMNSCIWVNEHINDYLDGALTGLQMQKVAQHIERCSNCRSEFDSLRETQAVLAQLEPRPMPADLGLRLRVALSHELARAREPRMERVKLAWENTLAPLLLQASAGLASTLLLLGTVGLAVGMFTHPQKLSAQDEPLGMATPPHFLYASAGSDESRFGAAEDPLVIMAMVNASGRVYDYRILSGTLDSEAKSKLESLMLLSLFEPARRFGEPVRGVVILSFAGVAVKG
jgi:hypothetical protein